jgi:TnpA family transposase
MPIHIFTEAQRATLDTFPAEITHEDLITFFTLSEADKAQIPIYSAPHNRLGFALQLCTLRFMGFVPEELTRIPPAIVEYVAEQITVEPVLVKYGARVQTRTDHAQVVQNYLGYRKAEQAELTELSIWLLDRALEHDKPSLLFELACQKLRTEKIVRPAVWRLERLITAARRQAQTETMRRLAPLLTEEKKQVLDAILVPDLTTGGTPLAWLRRPATANSPKAILSNLEKLRFLQELGINTWPLDTLNPNRLKLLAQVARRSSGQALQRTPAERRYPILTAFLAQSLVDITDETLDMFDRCLWETATRAERDLETFRKTVARTTNETLILFKELGRTVLDPTIRDTHLRRAIYERIAPATLQQAVTTCEKIIRPLDDNHFDFLERRYSYLRQFTPALLAAFAFQSNVARDPLLQALEMLRQLNAEQRRALPADAPLDFVPSKWWPYVVDQQGYIHRHYYELCVLWELRGALRAGNIWLATSRRYANPETYLIPTERWPELRPEVCRQVQLPENSSTRLEERTQELTELLPRVDALLSGNGKARMDDGHLIVSPLQAEDRPDSAVELEQRIDSKLPHIELSALLIEVDRWTQFSQHLTHASGSEPRSKDFLPHLYAALLAHGCNIGLAKMAQIADLNYDRLAWCNNWYLREDTLQAATNALVNFHYHQPLAAHWGGGTLSSSDGQRFPTSGKIRNATALPRYFGYGRGVTFYTWTSDQFSQYGTKVIPATVRDATYILDAILDNETELSLSEHTTDTAGYTEIIFALFDLLGMQFAPRLRDLGDQQLYRLDRGTAYPTLRPRLKGLIKQPLILARWDDMLRVAGSLKLGWVTASLFISKLQAYPRQNALTRVLQEYGRLIKTIFILRYLESESYRRTINRQLNKGEALHALRRFLFFANEGILRRRQEEAQTNQAQCLNLLTNAVVVWNTLYMARVLEELLREGICIDEADLALLSPVRSAHLNPYGKFDFDVERELRRTGLRPLR